jgi:hypothetical protein
LTGCGNRSQAAMSDRCAARGRMCDFLGDFGTRSYSCRIFHRYEPRTLAAAVRFYCDRPHAASHSAETDVRATAEVLDAMVARYPDLPATTAETFVHMKKPGVLDVGGWFAEVNGEVRFRHGKRYRGQPLAHVARTDPGYVEWMLGEDFFDDTKGIVRRALAKVRTTVCNVRQCPPGTATVNTGTPIV